jgi:hypothetical protein
MKMPRREVMGRFGFCARGRRVEGLFYHGVVMVKLMVALGKNIKSKWPKHKVKHKKGST